MPVAFPSLPRLVTTFLNKKPVIPTCALCLLVTTVSCSSTPESPATDPQAVLSGTDEQIFVGDPMEMNYNPNVIMKRAESFFEKESYPEAIVEYKHFLDLHRNHVLAPYAQYKIALSHYKRFKTIDRDPHPIEQSLKAFQTLLAEFPQSRYEAEAREKIRTCHERLAQHHLLVARFYYKRESYLAAAHRYEKVITTYPTLEAATEAMFLLAKTYQQLGAEDWAADWLMALVQRHPDNPYYDDSLEMLAELQPRHPNIQLAQLNGASRGPVLLAAGYHPGQEAQSHLPNHVVNSGSPSLPQPSLSPNGQSPLPNSSVSDQCSLGDWCESGNQTQRSLPASATRVCQPGRWC